MKLGIFAKTFRGDSPSEVLSAARATGYAAVQYNLSCSGLGALPAEIRREDADRVRAAAAREDIEISAVSATYNMIHPDLAERRRGRDSFVAIAGAARLMGTKLLTVCTGSRDATDPWRHHPDNAGPEAFRDLIQECERLVAVADACDLFIGIEPELANVVDTPRRARELMDVVGSARLRIVLDPANLFEVASPSERRTLIEGAVDLLGDRIALAHAKDRAKDGGFVAAGKGVIDFVHYLKCLRRAGFDGTLVAHGLSADEATGVASYLGDVLSVREEGL